MVSIDNFVKVYRDVGFDVEIHDNKLVFKIDDVTVTSQVDEEWLKAINSFFKAKQYTFDSECRSLVSYKAIEFQIIRLDPAFFPRPEHIFEDDRGNKVIINTASQEFILSLLTSAEISQQVLDLIKTRIKRRAERRRRNPSGSFSLRFDDLVYIPYTAKYQVPRKLKSDVLEERGMSRVKACLFKLSFSNNECWELREAIKSKGSSLSIVDEDLDLTIPRADYLDDLVSYYKVAKSSQFPNQSFLSYYHVLEYFFLRISDESVFEAVKTHVNSLNFNTSYENINKLLAIVKKVDKTSDETEMLKSVLNKFVNEKDLIEFLLNLEKEAGEKVFSNTKKVVFGEKATIKLEIGHALSNSAKVIKHIRNSLVHSSDRYSREDCFLPFSESESMVFDRIPLIKYLAERVIFATAK